MYEEIWYTRKHSHHLRSNLGERTVRTNDEIKCIFQTRWCITFHGCRLLLKSTFKSQMTTFKINLGKLVVPKNLNIWVIFCLVQHGVIENSSVDRVYALSFSLMRNKSLLIVINNVYLFVKSICLTRQISMHRMDHSTLHRNCIFKDTFAHLLVDEV